MIHPCINNNEKYPDNKIECYGQLCSDCPFTVQFKERGLRKSVKLLF